MHCTHGHLVKVIDGPCSDCARDRQTAQRHRNAEGRLLAQALRASGVPLDADHLAEGHRLLAALNLARYIPIGELQ